MRVTRSALGAFTLLVLALLACKSSSGSESTPADEEAKSKFGPCATMTISSPSGAFDKEKMGECRTCCDQKSPGYSSYYYHFEGNQPPGRCRCVGGASAGSDCAKTKDLAGCLTCCSGQKQGANWDSNKGCSCQ